MWYYRNMPVLENIRRIKDDVHAVCLRVGRESAEVRLMAVSKFHELPRIEEALGAGQILFGESRVQEAVRKFAPLMERRPEVELHLIGRLQRNKAAAAAALFDTVQSIDRIEIVRELGRVAQGGQTLSLLFELNSGEETKSGFENEDSLFAAVEDALKFDSLKPRGLMTMAPFTDDEKSIRAAFRRVVKMQKRLRQLFPDCGWDCLSMGMSNDYKIAIEEGSTLVRIGTAIFGERQ
jgi:pyridoxal phosphate enzyme (YggS family)